MAKSKKSNLHNAAANTANNNNNNGSALDVLLQDMPLAKAVLNKDLSSLQQIIESSLPQSKAKTIKVQDLTLEKSVGEAFTGGRSTPVYYIHAKVCIRTATKKTTVVKDRYFVVKLVTMLGDEQQQLGDNIDAQNNNDNTDKHLIHKRESYAVERRFYEYIAPRLKNGNNHDPTSLLTVGTNLAVPKLLTSDHSGVHPLPIACWLMTDIRVQYPLHPTILVPHTHMRLALIWLAKFHALFWKDPVGDWRRVVWERGGFWNKSSDASSNVISTSWLQTCQWMSTHKNAAISSLTSPKIKTLASRMQSIQKPLAELMLQQSKSTTWSTLIHGDYKAANLFFSSLDGTTNDTNDNEEAAAAAVDFQYSGAGVPAEDVAYLLFPDALVNYWNDEEELLQFYHEQLMEALILANKGGPSSLPLETFVALYQLSRLELLLYWLQKGWVGSTEGDAKLVVAIEATLDKLDGGNVLPDKNEYKSALEKFLHDCPSGK